MSGTSMDGLDISYCRYNFDSQAWTFSIVSINSITYPPELLQKLKESSFFSARDLLLLDKEIGLFFANEVNSFLKEGKIDSSEVDAICSHGHTIFHQPELGYTYQIGCGETIAYKTKIKVLNDFRQKDVVAGGQGAPLVPIGDQLLFSNEADTFLNLGGFANCTSIQNNKVSAFDICPANLPLNRIVQETGLEFDRNGEISSRGQIDSTVLEKLNNLPFYTENGPKSLGTEWLNESFMPLLKNIKANEDKLATSIEHIAIQIGKTLNEIGAKKTFVSGGGVKNDFLLKRIKHYTNSQLTKPSLEIIDYKESIIFGFLGALYFEHKSNSLSSVTGAQHNTTGGVLHIP